MYLFVAAITFAFTACGGGESVTEETTEVVVEQAVVADDTTAVTVDDTTAINKEAEAKEEVSE